MYKPTSALFTLSILISFLSACGDEATAPGNKLPAQNSEVQAESNEHRWWSPGEGRPFPEVSFYANNYGLLETYNQLGTTNTAGNPFFEAIGSNGRACVTCHQPADGMSLSLDSIQQQWQKTQGKDPLFAAVDGSNCPSLPQQQRSSHSLLLEHGLIRVFRPWPPKDEQGEFIEPQFTIEVVRDPSTCNVDPEYGLNSNDPNISVFRRPRPAANLKFITAVGFPFEPKDGLPLPRNPINNQPMSGNITADRRAWTLEAQARDALKTHLEYVGEPSEELIASIVAFEKQIYTAQAYGVQNLSMISDGALGGAQALAKADAGVLNSATRLPIWDEFESWLKILDPESFDDAVKGLSPEQISFKRSVARGVKFFRDRTFLVRDNAGITDMGFGNPVRNDCNFCHNMTKSGMDVAPGQVDLGTSNEPFADPAPHLPLFKLSCKNGFAPHAHLGKTVYTSDPGLALTTGRCKDIGKITIQSMRGLAARAPYFSNGSAQSIEDIVDYYDRRYQINLSDQEKQDLTNLMSVL